LISQADFVVERIDLIALGFLLACSSIALDIVLLHGLDWPHDDMAKDHDKKGYYCAYRKIAM
jgi:hypothetical protein